MDGAMREIADQLERLAGEIRGVVDAGGGSGGAAGAPLEAAVEAAIAEARRRLEAEADRVVAAAVRVLESAPSASIAQAEREARERILAATEAACERIEAVDHAQERVARALTGLGAPPDVEAGRG
jgi:hypothetical protein